MIKLLAYETLKRFNVPPDFIEEFNLSSMNPIDHLNWTMLIDEPWLLKQPQTCSTIWVTIKQTLRTCRRSVEFTSSVFYKTHNNESLSRQFRQYPRSRSHISMLAYQQIALYSHIFIPRNVNRFDGKYTVIRFSYNSNAKVLYNRNEEQPHTRE